MKLPPKFRLTLTGSIDAFRSRQVVQDGFSYPFSHMLCGMDVREDLFKAWGLTMEVEEIIGDDLEEADMCNLYRLKTGPDELAALFNARITKPVEWKPEIYPRYTAPVIISHEGERRIGPMTWGFPTEVQGKTKRIAKHVTNARNIASPFWKGSAANPARRCLVPFTQFAEPRPGKDPETGRPAQWWFSITDQPVAAFAGLWRPTDAGPVYAFLTCDPNPLVKPLHGKAMPVILLPDDHERWLTCDYDEVLALQTSYPSQMMAVE